MSEYKRLRKKEKPKPRMTEMTPEEQRVFQRAWKRVRRTVHGALVNQIHCHGPIDTGHLPSAAKRVVGQLKDPFFEIANAFIEEMRKAQVKVQAENTDYGHLEECKLCEREKQFCVCY